MYKISPEDAEIVSRFTWYKTSHGYYATRIKKTDPIGIPGQLVYLHQLIMCPPIGVEIDHINRDKADNQRENLRYADRSMNTLNIGIQKNNKSGTTGVQYCPIKNKWRAYLGQKRIAGLDSYEEALMYRKQFESESSLAGIEGHAISRDMGEVVGFKQEIADFKWIDPRTLSYVALVADYSKGQNLRLCGQCYRKECICGKEDPSQQ